MKLGILPGGTGTQRLSRLISAGNAIEFILRGRIVDPRAALELHLIHELVDDARARAMEVAEELAAMPPVSMAMVKRAVYTGVDLPLFHGNRVESDASYQTRLSDDAVVAMQHYVGTCRSRSGGTTSRTAPSRSSPASERASSTKAEV